MSHLSLNIHINIISGKEKNTLLPPHKAKVQISCEKTHTCRYITRPHPWYESLSVNAVLLMAKLENVFGEDNLTAFIIMPFKSVKLKFLGKDEPYYAFSMVSGLSHLRKRG